ncbi:Retrovirus-related Pol polyprotein from transposon RE2 [Sesamum angolense]|uniref:Retrovirus-related Pol polyprotein from transposon RE2 n=1 Tax=Sesamum angolense TaxID=2727404 RepID=A0AAE2BWW0_9LAMI|nr:Retrovirus-related Pol polyprotein from transposon RE2 [Sesamum angolense]
MLVQYEATTHKPVPVVLVGEASTSKAKGKRAGRWKRKKGKERSSQPLLAPRAPLLQLRVRAKVLEKSRKLSKDEMILKLGGGKVVAVEAVGSLSLVISDHIRIELKDCYYVPLNGVAKKRNRTLLDMVQSTMSFMKLPPSFWGYSLETAATIERSGRKEKSDPVGHVLLEKGFPADSQRDEVLLEESSEAPQQNGATYFEPSVPADGVPILRRLTRESRPLEREVTTFKARLVAKGYTQRPRVDFEETYSLIAMAKSIRVLLAIALCWIRTESLSSPKVHLRPQTNFPKLEHILMKSYGFMTSSKNKHDSCVYKKISGSTVAYLVLYVDDILLIGNDVKMLGDIIAWLSMQFSMKVIGLGSMQYVVQCTKPDVTYALSMMSRYQACAEEAHWSAVKTRFSNLKKTKDMFLIYGGRELILEGYSDASFQLDDDDAKSQSGFIFKLNGGVVAWKSSKQAIAADSTTEAEYIAAAEVAKEAVSMKNYIQELGVVPKIAEPWLSSAITMGL